MKKTIMLIRNGTGWYSEDHTRFCNCGLRALWTIPRGVDVVYLTISLRPMKESYHLSIDPVRGLWGQMELVVPESGNKYKAPITTSSQDYDLQDIIGDADSFYIKMEHYE